VPDTVAQSSTWSKTLFGNRHMLRVADVIARVSPVFTARELQESTNLAASTVHRLLTDLSAVELLERVPRGKGERFQRYERRPHAFWEAAMQLSAEAVGVQVPGGGLEADGRSGNARGQQ